MRRIFNNFVGNPKDDVLSGLTVALALVPEAVAFAFVAGIDPGNEVGMAMAQPIEYLGQQWLFITLLLVGGFQILAGVFRLGKFVRLIPHPVMMGFVNGLAIVIFLSQLNLFKTTADGQSQWMQGSALWTMLALVGLTMLIMFLLPKLTKKIPSALVAIIVVAAITIWGGMDVSTVGSFIRDGGGEGLKGGLPVFQTQIFGFISSLEGHWGLIVSTAFLLAAVGLIES